MGPACKTGARGTNSVTAKASKIRRKLQGIVTEAASRMYWWPSLICCILHEDAICCGGQEVKFQLHVLEVTSSDLLKGVLPFSLCCSTFIITLSFSTTIDTFENHKRIFLQKKRSWLRPPLILVSEVQLSTQRAIQRRHGGGQCLHFRVVQPHEHTVSCHEGKFAPHGRREAISFC